MTFSIFMPGWKALRGLAHSALSLPNWQRQWLPIIYCLATSYTCSSGLILMHVGTHSVCTCLGPGNISLKRTYGEHPKR